jgi:hypothetical protein
VKRIIINPDGEIISHELHSPFSYLSTLIDRKNGKNEAGWCSESVSLGVQGSLKPPENDLERFFSMIRFDSREKLKDLPDFQLDA